MKQQTQKRIIDVACGSKMFWFDKNNPDVEFCDVRTLDRTEYYPGHYIEIAPDTVCNFTNLPFADNSFYLVVFAPPTCHTQGTRQLWQRNMAVLKATGKRCSAPDLTNVCAY